MAGWVSLGAMYELPDNGEASYCKHTSLGPQGLIASIGVGRDCENICRVERASRPNSKANNVLRLRLDVCKLLVQASVLCVSIPIEGVWWATYSVSQDEVFPPPVSDRMACRPFALSQLTRVVKISILFYTRR